MAAIELPQLQKATKKAAGFPTVYEITGSPGRIRTCDTLVPNQVLYQAELLPEIKFIIIMISFRNQCTRQDSNLQPPDS